MLYHGRERQATTFGMAKQTGPNISAFLNKHSVASETLMLTSGAVEVSRWSWRFPSWAGVPPKDTYGGKAVVDCEGSPVFVELAMIHVLRDHGFDWAVWVDNYRRRFRDAMPPAVCELPTHARVLYDRIATINGGRRGCWDILAWNKEGVLFVECKRRGKDRMTLNQRTWLESALKAGLHLDRFAICAWEIE